MTMLWVFISVLTMVIVAILILPLINKRNKIIINPLDYDINVYKNQLAEIDREVIKGAISKIEAEAARVEVSRRILAVDNKIQNTAIANNNSTKLNGKLSYLAIFIALSTTIGSLMLYLNLGQPELMPKPLAARDGEMAKMQAATKSNSGMSDVIDKLEEKLADNPDGIDGWMLLGRSYLAIGQLDKALNAYKNAVAINKSYPNLLSSYGEVMVMDGKGSISEIAVAIFKQALILDKDDVRARFFLAQADYQIGNLDSALKSYIALANSAPATAPWQPMLREAAIEIANELEINIDDKLPNIPKITQNNSDMANSDNNSDNDNQKMIKSMVLKLAERMQDNPDNIDGWLRLGRSYMVLKQFSDAANAFNKASIIAPKNVDILLKAGRALRAVNNKASLAKAAVLMQQVLKINDKNLEALWMAAIDFANQKNGKKANEYFNKALKFINKTSSDYIELRLEADNILATID